MSGTIILIIVFGLLFYLMHRGGGHGLGCCGGHDHQGHGEDHQHSTTEGDKKNKELSQHEHHH